MDQELRDAIVAALDSVPSIARSLSTIAGCIEFNKDAPDKEAIYQIAQAIHAIADNMPGDV